MRKRKQKILIGLFVLITIAVFGVKFANAQLNTSSWQKKLYTPQVVSIKKMTWANHSFEIGKLSTKEYKTTGNKKIQFTKSGFYAPSFSLPRSRLLDVNMHKKNKVKIIGSFSGALDVENPATSKLFHFSEFAIYIVDESGNARGMRNLGTRENAVRGHTRDTYDFTELTVENTGNEFIVTDSSGLELRYSKDFKWVTAYGKKDPNSGGNYGELNPDEQWFLQINCHVNGIGHCKLDMEEIIVNGS